MINLSLFFTLQKVATVARFWCREINNCYEWLRRVSIISSPISFVSRRLSFRCFVSSSCLKIDPNQMKRYLLCDVKSNQSQITNFPMSQKTNTAKEQKYVRLIANKLQTEFITHKLWSRPDCLVTDSKAKAVMDVSLLYFISIPIALTVCFNNIIFVAKRRQTTHKYKATQSVDGILWASKSRCPWSIHECFWTFIDHWKIRIEFCLLFSFACLLLLVCSLDWCVFFSLAHATENDANVIQVYLMINWVNFKRRVAPHT